MKTISVKQLIEILLQVTTHQFINMVTVTPVRMNKRGNPYYGEVFKAKNGNYMIGTDYEKRVNVNLSKEGQDKDFVASKNNVGDHVSKVLLYNDKTKKFYLQYERFDNSKIETTYLYKGNTIEKSAFESFMPSTNNYSNQGLDRTVNVMSVTVNNIKKITVNGETYLVV